MKQSLKVIFLFLFSCILGQSFAQNRIATGLVQGDYYEANYYQGRLFLTCQQGRQFKRIQWNCYNDFITPSMTSKFVSDSRTPADEVYLTNYKSNGEMVEKVSDFSAVNGLSLDEFNLWADSFFQQPLLEEGLNTLEYMLMNQGHEVEYGQFEVYVKRNPSKICADYWMTSFNMHDCVVPQFICAEYFRRNTHTCR